MISISYAPKNFQAFTDAVQTALEDSAIDIVNELQQRSPVGATGDLKEGWDVDIRSFEAVITNRAPDAILRIAGRAPGRFPPYGEGTPLGRWAAAKGIPAFLVARKIAREGTERWQQQKNFAGLDQEGKIVPGGAIDDARNRLTRKLRNIKVD